MERECVANRNRIEIQILGGVFEDESISYEKKESIFYYIYF